MHQLDEKASKWMDTHKNYAEAIYEELSMRDTKNIGRKKTRRWHIQPNPRQCKANSFSQTNDGQPEQQSRRYRGQIEAE